MSKYLGDFAAGDTLDFKFTTFRPSTGAPFTLAGSPAISIYKDNSTTQSTSGVTLTVDFDGVTGLHHVRITTSSDATFYADGSAFECVITTGTVDSVSVVGSCIGRFTLRDQACLYPTTSGIAQIADGILNRDMELAGAANNINITSIVSNVFQAVNTLVVDDQVAFVGTAPNNFSLGVAYWVRSTSLSSTTFTLSLTQGGLGIATSSTGAFTAVKVTDRTPLSALRYLRNKVEISGSTMIVYLEDDVSAAWTAAVTTTAGLNPVTSLDPN